MAGFNKVILMGNMVADPELKQTQSGISVCSFRIAVQRRFSKQQQDQQQQTADFFNIVAWRQQADFICRYFRKGNPILISGSLQTRNWTDNQGQKRYETEVVVDEVSFVGPAGQGGAAAGDAPRADAGRYTPDAYGAAPSFGTASASTFEEIPNDDSLPF